MKPEPAPATPDYMALLCLIGGAVREAGASNLLLQLLLIAGYCPPLRMALLAWILAEERYAPSEFEYELFAPEDGEGGADELRPGWANRGGTVELWRHVTRFGRALLIPIQWCYVARKPVYFMRLVSAQVRPVVGSLVSSLTGLSHFKNFALGFPNAHNCVLIVPLS